MVARNRIGTRQKVWIFRIQCGDEETQIDFVNICHGIDDINKFVDDSGRVCLEAIPDENLLIPMRPEKFQQTFGILPDCDQIIQFELSMYLSPPQSNIITP